MNTNIPNPMIVNVNKPTSLRKAERQFVVDDWHHACLTALNQHPSDDNRGTDHDFTFEEIRAIIDRYGKSPGPYWDEVRSLDNV